MHDAITFEQSGKPALAICTTPFAPTGRMIAATLGLPDYAFALVEHPIGSRTLAEIKERARRAYEQAVGILVGGRAEG